MNIKEYTKYKYECLARSCHDDNMYCKTRGLLQILYSFVLIQENARGDDLLAVTQSLVKIKNNIEELLSNK